MEFFGNCPPTPTAPHPPAKSLGPFLTGLPTVVLIMTIITISGYSPLAKNIVWQSVWHRLASDWHPASILAICQNFVDLSLLRRYTSRPLQFFLTFSTSFLTALKETKRFKSTR